MGSGIRDMAAGLALAVIGIILFSLYLAVTPDQFSAEADILREEMEAAR